MNNNILSIYEDYYSFREENKDIFNELIKRNSVVIKRFSSVISVVDYLYYNSKVSKLSEDEEYIFSSGFDYIVDEIEYIKIMLHELNNDYNEFERLAPTINLLLYINDVRQEINDIKNSSFKKKEKDVIELEEKVQALLRERKIADENYYGAINELTYEIFDLNEIELNTVNSIFYEIALEYNIIDEDDDNNIYNEEILKRIEGR
jgi:hypothetical protein